ncbi:hypothetical protein ACQ4M3_24490 [Leptolyngbya sp. AN03gr2]|uniref:hypothetical protein n=1 Tax=unclassified Leptolyngbya TaxID=2650499 RepID=UPI003D31BC0F
MNLLRLNFLERLSFQYEPDLRLFQAQIAPLLQDAIDQMGLQFETVDALLRIRESEIEIYTDDREAPVRFVIQEAPDQHEQLQWTVFPA